MDDFLKIIKQNPIIRCNSEKELNKLKKFCINRGIQIRGCLFFSPRMEDRTFLISGGYLGRYSGSLEKLSRQPMSLSDIQKLMKEFRNSTKDWIRDQMPESWLKAAQHYSCVWELVDRIMNTVPYYLKHQGTVSSRRQYIKQRIFAHEGSIRYVIDMSGADIEKWSKVEQFILNYREACR